MTNYKRRYSSLSHEINHTYVKTNEQYMSYCDDQKTAIWDKYVMIFREITATSFRIMGNIHPNPNHLSEFGSESLHVMAQNKHHELRLYTFINRAPLKSNRNLFCGTWWRKQRGIWIIRRQIKWNPDYISPNHGKHLSESSAAFSVHLSEYCVRNNMVKFHKLQATMHFASPHNDKMAAKVIINTGR